ncbi:glutathione S-transferase C-terminal domain-containing protein [Streptomyces albiaxialis]|uniref:Glutathione S-transferase C-terminal domain-containing protein n=1 Tax=Streptomyces albiaxialis TaxID=329523 RepID=A0ABN2VPJ2_9ACTN
MSLQPPNAEPSLRGRIGRDARSGHHPVPHRYRLHLALSCPRCLGLAVTHSLLGPDAAVRVSLLPAVPDAPDGEYAALRPLYEASAHRHRGPAVAPVLSDDWTGRIVSTHAPGILADLVRRFGGAEGSPLAPLTRGAERESEEVGRLCGRGIAAAAQRAGEPGAGEGDRERALATLLDSLGTLERRLAHDTHVLGDRLTVADVRVWVTLVQLDTVHRWHLDASAVHRVTAHPHLWAYARRLAAHPAFGGNLDLDGIARRHHARCRGEEAAGAAVRIVDWEAHLPGRAGNAERAASARDAAHRTAR